MGLNAALATASRSLGVFTAGIQVAGENISNSESPGYIREQLQIVPDAPYRKGNLLIGTGAFATGIVQTIDQFLETRIHRANTEFTAADARNSIYKQLEGSLGELGENDLSTSLDDFLASINDVINEPDSAAVRQVVIQEGQSLAADVSAMRLRVDELRRTQTVKVNQLVDEANQLIEQIASLNPQIVKLESAGLSKSDAGGLRVQRYAALNRLSEIVPIRYIEREGGGVDVFTDSDYLIITGQTQRLETYTIEDRGSTVTNVRLETTNKEMGSASGGELRGIIEGRDAVLGGFVDKLDSYAGALISEFNRVYASGEGLAGYTTVTGQTRLDDTTSALNAAGLAFTPKHGSFDLKVINKLTGIATTTNIAVDLDGIGTDTSLQSLKNALDAVGNVDASITGDGRLKIDAAANFEVRFGNDTSDALAALGINTFFTGSDGGNIGVNAAVLADQRLFASSLGGGPADNRNAIALANFITGPAASLNGASLDEFYETAVGSVAQASASEAAVAEGFQAFRDSLRGQREQSSGVNVDEEIIKVLEFQRAFQSAARLVSTIDELFTILLNM